MLNLLIWHRSLFDGRHSWLEEGRLPSVGLKVYLKAFWHGVQTISAEGLQKKEFAIL